MNRRMANYLFASDDEDEEEEEENLKKKKKKSEEERKPSQNMQSNGSSHASANSNKDSNNKEEEEEEEEEDDDDEDDEMLDAMEEEKEEEEKKEKNKATSSSTNSSSSSSKHESNRQLLAALQSIQYKLTALRSRLQSRVEAMKLPLNPLDELIDLLGGESMVAEMTGRTHRILHHHPGVVDSSTIRLKKCKKKAEAKAKAKAKMDMNAKASVLTTSNYNLNNNNNLNNGNGNGNGNASIHNEPNKEVSSSTDSSFPSMYPSTTSTSSSTSSTTLHHPNNDDLEDDSSTVLIPIHLNLSDDDSSSDSDDDDDMSISSDDGENPYRLYDEYYYFEDRGVKRGSEEGANMKEKTLFQQGRKRIAIISEAASAGISLHSDRRAPNQTKRIHIILELPWSADKIIQQCGRSHRSNQRISPDYLFLLSTVGGELRFVSTISKRLSALGALTQGSRKATGALDFSQFDFNSNYAKKAVRLMLETIFMQSPSLRRAVAPDGKMLYRPKEYQDIFLLNQNERKEYKGYQEGDTLQRLLMMASWLKSVDFKMEKGDLTVMFFNRLLGLELWKQHILVKYLNEVGINAVNEVKRNEMK